MKKASPQELRLAQSHTYLFVRALEGGINAINQFQHEFPEIPLKRRYRNMSETAKFIAELNPALRLTDITLEMHDWDGTAALTIGHETGTEYALEKAITEGATV